jgi:hypothetical protein
MTNLRELFEGQRHRRELAFPSVTLALRGSGVSLSLKLDNRDTITDAAYTGDADPWYSALCELLPGRGLPQALEFSVKDFDEAFSGDQFYWDLRSERSGEVQWTELEHLRATLDLFRGRDYLYLPQSPLICRCFGVRESDLVEFMKSEERPTLELLGQKTRAGMGCRSCVSQLKRWLSSNAPETGARTFKQRPVAEWVLLVDEQLALHPARADWGLEVEGMRGNQVFIGYARDASQKEEEELALKLQGFLAAGVDPDLGFFLRRSRQR